jgi:hypothetical protein
MPWSGNGVVLAAGNTQCTATARRDLAPLPVDESGCVVDPWVSEPLVTSSLPRSVRVRFGRLRGGHYTRWARPRHRSGCCEVLSSSSRRIGRRLIFALAPRVLRRGDRVAPNLRCIWRRCAPACTMQPFKFRRPGAQQIRYLLLNAVSSRGMLDGIAIIVAAARPRSSFGREIAPWRPEDASGDSILTGREPRRALLVEALKKRAKTRIAWRHCRARPIRT